MTRKAIGLASVSVTIRQYTDKANPSLDDEKNPPAPGFEAVHIDIVQNVSGLASSDEKRCLDNRRRTHSDFLFGEVIGQTKFMHTKDITTELGDAYLASDWDGEEEHVYSLAWSEKYGWKALQIWGFQIVEGERRHVRKVVVSKGDERAEFRFVYDFQP